LLGLEVPPMLLARAIEVIDYNGQSLPMNLRLRVRALVHIRSRRRRVVMRVCTEYAHGPPTRTFKFRKRGGGWSNL
jgi:hypothetical protein